MKGLIIDDWMSDEFFNFLFSETIFFFFFFSMCVCVWPFFAVAFLPASSFVTS